MLTIISPSKTLDFNVRDVKNSTQPQFLKNAATIADELKQYSPKDLARLLDISPKLALLNANRYTEWDKGAHQQKGKASVLAYKGDVYQGMQAQTFSDIELDFAQNHLRIISGLYGILRPLDLILPYRLDMATSLKVLKVKNLYDFWTDKVTSNLSATLQETKSETLINLASEEYFKAIDTSKLGVEVITPVFRDYKNGHYKIISFFAKKARGMMSRFIINNGITNPKDIKLFKDDGYFYTDKLSENNIWTFTRG